MSHPMQEQLRNRLLRTLPVAAYALLRTHLEPIELEKGHVLVEADEPFTWVVFPEHGLASVVNRSFNGKQLEVGVFGRDGMGSTASVLGADRTPHAIFMQVEGYGLRIRAERMQAAMEQSDDMRALLMLYVQGFMVQVAQTALSNGVCTVEQRLARWLLMVHDRMDGDEVRLTHEFLAVMLGVRRTGVTLAMHTLEGEHMIKARRGVITILSREKLKALVTDGYGVAEAEYERLIGPMPIRAAA